jgi:hypothetical protein
VKAAAQRHPAISAAIFTVIIVVIMAVRLGPDAFTPVGLLVTASLGLFLGAGFYFGLRFGPRGG